MKLINTRTTCICELLLTNNTVDVYSKISIIDKVVDLSKLQPVRCINEYKSINSNCFSGLCSILLFTVNQSN